MVEIIQAVLWSILNIDTDFDLNIAISINKNTAFYSNIKSVPSEVEAPEGSGEIISKKRKLPLYWIIYKQYINFCNNLFHVIGKKLLSS